MPPAHSRPCWAAIWHSLSATVHAAVLVAGLTVTYIYTKAALGSTESALTALGVDIAKVSLLSSQAAAKVFGPTLALASSIAASAVMMALFRSWLLLASARTGAPNPGGFNSPSFWYICLAEALIIPLLSGLCSTLMMLFGIGLVWLAVAFGLDKSAHYILISDIGQKLSLARQVSDTAASLVGIWGSNQAAAAPQLINELSPPIAHLSSLLTSSSACPITCIDLSSWNFMLPSPRSYGYGLPAGYVKTGSNITADGGSCICDVSRLDLMQPLASRAWGEQLLWAVLGAALASLGATWLLMGAVAGKEAVACESNPVTQRRQSQPADLLPTAGDSGSGGKKQSRHKRLSARPSIKVQTRAPSSRGRLGGSAPLPLLAV